MTKTRIPGNWRERHEDETVGWQAQKSAGTRNRFVAAAIDCFIDVGYGRTTTGRIAKQAGLSRGAMLHHFPTQMEVVKEAVDYLHAKRLKAFRKSATEAPCAGKGRLHQALQMYWQHAHHPTFVAFFELSVAARTDAKLKAILRPAQKAFDDEWRRVAAELLPEWQTDKGVFELALDLTRYVLEGMAVNILTHEETERKQQLLEYLEYILRRLRPPLDTKRQAEDLKAIGDYGDMS